MDVWSLGIILAELALGVGQLWPELKLAQLMRKVLSLINCNSDTSVLSRLAREHSCWTRYEVSNEFPTDNLTFLLKSAIKFILNLNYFFSCIESAK